MSAIIRPISLKDNLAFNNKLEICSRSKMSVI